MKFSEEQKEIIINAGAFDYDLNKIANILDVDCKELKQQYKNINSEFYQLFKKGKDRFDYAIDNKLFQMARNGDIKALEKLEQRERIRKSKG